MPSVYTSEDPDRIAEQARAIKRCIALMDSRIEFVKAQREEIEKSGVDYVRGYYDHYLFPLLDLNTEAKENAYSKIPQGLKQSLFYCDDDIRRLHLLRSHLQAMLNGADDGLLLVANLLLNTLGSERARQSIIDQNQAQLQQVETDYEAILREHNEDKTHPAVVAAAKKRNICISANSLRLADFDGETLLFFYRDLDKILKQQVLNKVEMKFTEYFEYLPASGTMFNMVEKPAFAQLIDENKQQVAETTGRIIKRHKAGAAEFPAHAEDFLRQAKETLMTAKIDTSVDKGSLTSILASFRNHFILKEKLKSIDQQDEESVAADLALLRAKARADREANEAEARAREAEAEKAQHKLAQEKAEREEKAEELKRQHKAALEEDRRLRRQQADKRQKEKEARQVQRHKDAVRRSNNLRPTIRPEEKLAVVTEEMVRANASTLRELFTATTKFRFSKIEPLARALGGELVDEGSRHPHICFNELYEFQCWEDPDTMEPADTTVKGSIAASHGKGSKKGTAFVYCHNLKLVKKAFLSVMPPNYAELLDMKSKPRPTIS